MVPGEPEQPLQGPARLPECWDMARADPQERGSYSWLEGPCETLGLPLGKTAVMPSTR